MTFCVLDASVALAWVFEDENSLFAEYVIGALESERAAVPAIWSLEVINAVVSAVRRMRITERDATRFFSVLARLPLEFDEGAVRNALAQRVFSVALHYELAAYAASYLELALRRDLPVATEDRRLMQAALAAGVRLLQQ